MRSQSFCSELSSDHQIVLCCLLPMVTNQSIQSQMDIGWNGPYTFNTFVSYASLPAHHTLRINPRHALEPCAPAHTSDLRASNCLPIPWEKEVPMQVVVAHEAQVPSGQCDMSWQVARTAGLA